MWFETNMNHVSKCDPAGLDRPGRRSSVLWILCRGACSGSGVQWIGVVSYSKPVYNVM